MLSRPQRYTTRLFARRKDYSFGAGVPKLLKLFLFGGRATQGRCLHAFRPLPPTLIDSTPIRIVRINTVLPPPTNEKLIGTHAQRNRIYSRFNTINTLMRTNYCYNRTRYLLYLFLIICIPVLREWLHFVHFLILTVFKYYINATIIRHVREKKCFVLIAKFNRD